MVDRRKRDYCLVLNASEKKYLKAGGEVCVMLGQNVPTCALPYERLCDDNREIRLVLDTAVRLVLPWEHVLF
jgi:hypothetical protein